MSDLISRAALLEIFDRECIGECGCCKHNGDNDGKSECMLISNAPAVDAEPDKDKGELIAEIAEIVPNCEVEA